MNWLHQWQSLVGAIVSSFLAIGLFQYQRYIDRNKQRKSHIFTVIRALKRIRSHFENVKIEFARTTIERVKVSARTLALMNSPASADDQRASCSSIESIVVLGGKYLDILSTIPRDQDIAGDIIIKIDEIEYDIEQTTYAFGILLKRLRDAGEWTDRNENQETIALVDALKLLENFSNQRAMINETLERLQSL